MYEQLIEPHWSGLLSYNHTNYLSSPVCPYLSVYVYVVKVYIKIDIYGVTVFEWREHFS